MAADDSLPAHDAQKLFHIKATSQGLTESQKQLLETARARCARVIMKAPGKLPSNPTLTIVVSTGHLPEGQNAVTEPAGYWPNTALPSSAKLWLQKSAIAGLEQDGRLADILAHEIFHCLGFGFSWGAYGLIDKSKVDDPLFTGPQALTEYKAQLAKAGKDIAVKGVPIESEGGASQQAMHWRESVFGDELMTTVQKPNQPNYLGRITVASLADLGYGVDLSAAAQ